MTANVETNGTGGCASTAVLCPAEALMREHAALYRAKDLADEREQDHEDPLIADWSPDFLWKLMTERINAIEEMARIAKATSGVGAVYQLLIARSMVLTAHIPDRLWEGDPVAEREVKMLENHLECLMDSAIEQMLESISDPDLDLLMKYMGAQKPFPPQQAIRNLMAQVREQGDAPNVVVQ